MEKRAILAAVLMAALLIVYQMYFMPPTPAPKPSGQEAPPATAPTAPTPSGPAPAAPAPPAPLSVVPKSGPRPPEKTAVVEGPLYRAVVSSDGGKLNELTLRYRGEKPLVQPGESAPIGLTITAAGVTDIPVMSLTPDALRLGPRRPSGDLVLSGEDRGLRVRETLRFSADAYAIDDVVRIENTTGAPLTPTVALPWVTREHWTDIEKFHGQRPTEVLWATSGGHIEHIENLATVGQRTVEGSWIGLGSVWYLTALIPKTPGFELVASGEGKPAPKPEEKQAPSYAVIAVRATPTIAPGQAWEGRITIYAGPKEYERLVAEGLEGAINFGGFPIPRKYGGLPMEWLGVPILRLMNWVYRYVGNYGIAIILLTIVSKVIFYPLTVKSMRSMKAMQALAPQINSLRSKYKNDPQRLQRETLELYRQHHVNPMGGCLPMIAQIPIFYALYLALSVSVELQNAPFLCIGRAPSWVPGIGGADLWICDLANHDPTYILPILMGISMFMQQKMSPTTGDPRQAKMMLVMPFVFTFMFLNLPSGLVLYWFVSNVLQVLQQWLMDRGRHARPPGRGREVANARA